MTMRQHAKRKMRERSRFVFIEDKKFVRGTRCQFVATHPEFGVILTGWFIADSNNPVCHVL